MVDPAVSADAAAEAARVIRDHGPVREVRRQRVEAAGVHRLTDHEQRWASVGGGQRATDIVGNLGPGGFEHVRRRHDSFDRTRGENSSDLCTSAIAHGAGELDRAAWFTHSPKRRFLDVGYSERRNRFTSSSDRR
jgi:hypothetical protein